MDLIQVGKNKRDITRGNVITAATIVVGYPFCFDADKGTATAVDESRGWDIEKPAAGNLANFAGILTHKDSGKICDGSSPSPVDLFTPLRRGQLCKVFTNQNCTLGSTLLTLVAGSWELGGVGDGPVIAKAMQTVDRSSTSGTVLAMLYGVEPGASLGKTGVAGGKGPSPLIWDQCPWDEIGRDPSIGCRFFTDYMDLIDVTTGDGFIITAVTSGAIDETADAFGALIIDSAGNATADDGVNVQQLNCSVKPAAGVKIFFEARAKFVDAGDDQYFIGLAAEDTTLIAAGIMDDVVDKAGFFRIAASTADKISSISSRAAEDDATADVGDIVDDTYVNLGIVIDGLTSIKFYVDGVLVETGVTTDAIANAAMCLSYVAQVEQTSADAEMHIDWVKIAQVGGRV